LLNRTRAIDPRACITHRRLAIIKSRFKLGLASVPDDK
jgi:hypothetical protein